MIYARLPTALQAETVAAAVYMLNLIPSDALGGDFLRHALDTSLNRSINIEKPLLNTLRAYRAFTVVYNYNTPRGAKFAERGSRRQLVGYKDSIYYIQLPVQYKVVRTLHCQFVESSDLSEIPDTLEDTTEALDDQNFESNIVQARGNLQNVPNNFTIEVVQLETLSEEAEVYTYIDNPVVEANAVDKVDKITTVADLLEVGLDVGIEDEVLEGREPTTLGSLELPINETL